MSSLRTLDPFLPDESRSADGKRCPASFDPATLPLHCDEIPMVAQGLKECAMYQIQCLNERARAENCDLSPEEEDAIDDGFFLCDLSVVEGKLRAWRQLFPRIKPFYALKCNPDAMVAAVLGQHSSEVGFDCASVAEINLALKSTGGNYKRCVYANPQRSEADLATALSVGVEALTFDGAEELRKVKKAHEERLKKWEDERRDSLQEYSFDTIGSSPAPVPPEMILRILVPDTKSSVPLGEKFGAKPSDVAALTEEAINLELPVIGVSFHCGSGCHDPSAYGTAIQLAKEAIDVVNETKEMRRMRDRVESHIYQPCSILDIGGGYPGLDGGGEDVSRFCGAGSPAASGLSLNLEKKVEQETASGIAAVVSPLVDCLFPRGESAVHIISEPGRYFVESAFALCSRIYCSSTDTEGRHHYYIAQGVQGVFKDVILCGEKFFPVPLVMNRQSLSARGSAEYASMLADRTLFPSIVHGPSGEDFDIVCDECLLPEMKENDWLLFDRMGAYTLSIAAKSGSLPVRYVWRS